MLRFTGSLSSIFVIVFAVACSGGTSHRNVPPGDAGPDGEGVGGSAGGGGAGGKGGTAGNGGTAGIGGGNGGTGGATPDAGTTDGRISAEAGTDASTTDASEPPGDGGADASSTFVPGVVGDALPSLAAPACPIRLAVDAVGTPYAAYVNATSSLIEVSKLTGASWSAVGGPTMTGTWASSHCHSLALEPNGNPVVAFTDFVAAGPTYQVEVQRYTGTTWEPLGAPFASTYYVSWSEIAADSSGRVVLATSFASSVDVRRWDDVGKTWTPLGTPFFGAQQQVGEVHLTLKPDGNPVVAWLEGTGGSNAARLYAAEFDGVNWTTLGGAIDSVPDATQGLSPASVAWDGAPVVAWAKWLSGPRVFGVKRWNGSSWADLTPPADPLRQPFRVEVLAEAGHLTIAWGEDGDTRFQQYASGTWGTATSFHSGSLQKVAYPMLASGGGRLYMSHQGAGNDGYVLRMIP
ncbi:MAG TPA: hypothetical protein VHE30_21435 [Polyangiaceae bacterium]|nr:hypothetical protein [Polyangiaceae bacterium]